MEPPPPKGHTPWATSIAIKASLSNNDYCPWTILTTSSSPNQESIQSFILIENNDEVEMIFDENRVYIDLVAPAVTIILQSLKMLGRFI